MNTTRTAAQPGPDTRAHLLDAVREASASKYEILGELGPSARSVMAYLAREKSDRVLAVLLLERDPMSTVGEDRYTIAEANELDDRVPTLGITCDACQAPLATWAARCGVCGGEVVGTPDDPAVARRLGQAYSALLGSMPRPGGGSIYFARQGDALVALRLMTTGEAAEPFKLAVTPVDPTRAPMLPTPPAAPRTPDMTGATRRSKPTVTVATPTNTTRVCAQCGAEYPSDQRFCPTDGSPLRSKTGGTGIIGEIIAERYHVVKALGEGGMGQVYLAEQVKMRRMCALKVMRPQLATDPDAVRRFGAEAENASRIAHPNVAAIYDFGETPEGLVYLAMEFVDGPSLASILARERVMPPGRVAAIGKQVADALSAAHELGIVHRDLKPDNVMIVRAKDGAERVKVVDFGIAKAMTDGRTQMTRTGFVLGTPAYMSPEQISGDKLDGRSDLYSLGCMLFEMLTGRSPFSGPTGEIVLHRRLTEEAPKARALCPDCPKALDGILTRLLSRRANERFQHATELSEALDECVDEEDLRGGRPQTPAHSKATIVMSKGGATTVVRGTTRPTPRRKSKPRPNHMLYGVAAAVVVLAAAGVFAWRMISKQAPAPTTVAQAPAPATPVPTPTPVTPALTPDTQAAATPPPASVAPSTPSKKQPAQEKKPTRPAPVRPQPAPVVATMPPPTQSQPAPQPQPQQPQQVAQTPPTAAPATPPVVDLAAEIHHANDVVNQYVAALNAKDISRMKQLYPTMPAALESGLRALTSNATDFSATMTAPPNASVLGDAGDTEFGYSLSFYIPSQGKSTPSFRYHAALARQGGAWQIKSLTLLR